MHGSNLHIDLRPAKPSGQQKLPVMALQYLLPADYATTPVNMHSHALRAERFGSGQQFASFLSNSSHGF